MLSIGTVSQGTGALLLGFIGLALEWTTVLQFPDAYILQHTLPFCELEAAGADIAWNV
jgi:hypothetical protein